MSAPSVAQSADYFCELLDAIFLAGGEHAAMLSAYVDAGTQGRVLTVAAVAFGPDRLKKAHKQWQKLWGSTLCHMTDLHNRRGDFKDWDTEKVRSHFEQSIAIIDNFASYCIVTSCDIDEYATYAPTETTDHRKHWLDGFRNPYPWGMHMTTLKLASMANDKDGIHYFIEAGDKDQGQARKYLELQMGIASENPAQRIRSCTIVTKPAAPLLAASDILAWEWCKHVRREKDDSTVRYSLAKLLKEDRETMRGRLGSIASGRLALHHSGEALRFHLYQVQMLLKHDVLVRDPAAMPRAS
jgi:hypothetical protein